MSVIENFAAMSVQEQRAFADSLVKTINSESIFSSDVDFEIDNVEADDITGGLIIEVSHTNSVEVARAATWTCDDEDEASHDPGYDVEYENSIYEDARKAFKTTEAVIDDYRVSLEIADIDTDETIDVDVDEISHEDSGIGHYEYWGHTGYDSHHYVEVTGTIVKASTCYISFFVEPVDEASATEAVTED